MRKHLFLLFLLFTAFLCSCTPAGPVTVDTVAEEQQTGIVEFALDNTVSKETAALPSPAPTKEPTPTPRKPLEGVVIGLDPGHQLHLDAKVEPVAPGSGIKKKRTSGGGIGTHSRVFEYQVNLDVALLLRDMLVEQGATVYMTHEVLDVKISNIERAQFFNEHNVDLGFRIHCNQSSDYDERGAYMLIPAETKTQWFEQNRAAAQCILEEYLAATKLEYKYPRIEGIVTRNDQTGFNWCERPICTIEMGYLSNDWDDYYLTNPDFQVTMARGLANGIVRYFSDTSRIGLVTPVSTPTPVPSP